MGIGSMIRLMVTECTNIKPELYIRVSGKMICSMAMGRNHGPTGADTTDNTKKGISTVLALTSGKMGASTAGSGSRAKYMGSESTSGLMEDNTLVNGRIIAWMV